MEKDNIVLMMVSFFINEMEDSGISTDKEISDYFNANNEKAFKKMIKEYKKLQSLTRSKAVKYIARLKRENLIRSDNKCHSKLKLADVKH